MAITKRLEYKEEILPNQVIQIRTTTVVEEDGVELARILFYFLIVCSKFF